MNRIRNTAKKKKNYRYIHCKKELAVFPSPAGMSLIKLFLGGNNLVFSRPERFWSVTSRLETGKWLTIFYSVGKIKNNLKFWTDFPWRRKRQCTELQGTRAEGRKSQTTFRAAPSSPDLNCGKV
jgi:hypothetical protein